LAGLWKEKLLEKRTSCTPADSGQFTVLPMLEGLRPRWNW